MQALVCEMCGGHDIIKENGVYVCQHCGTKYSVEEAKKMMLGTVKIDTSDELKNLYEVARRAKEDNNGENASKYYDMILVKDPRSWEAAFYVVYFRATECRIRDIQSSAMRVAGCLGNVFKLIKENVEDEDGQKVAALEVSARCYIIADMMFESARDHYKNNSTVDDAVSDYVDRVQGVCAIYIYLSEAIGKFYPGDELLTSASVESYKRMNNMLYALWNSFPYNIKKATQNTNSAMIRDNEKKILALDPEYKSPFDLSSLSTDSSQSSGGCYVATAVYGSYNCPEVWTLRRFRDYTLANTWYGLAFIRFYYAVSPTLVKWFGNCKWFKCLTKPLLDRMEVKLRDGGVEDTPYVDKQIF